MKELSKLREVNIIQTKITIVGLHRLERVKFLKRVLLSDDEIKEDGKKVVKELKNQSLEVIFED